MEMSRALLRMGLLYEDLIVGELSEIASVVKQICILMFYSLAFCDPKIKKAIHSLGYLRCEMF